MLKTCPQCGVEFKTYNRKVKLCSRACQSASFVRAKTYQCAHCLKAFQRPNYVIKREAVRRFCSHACHLAWKVANARQRTCDVCGTTFVGGSANRRTCSKECGCIAKTTAQSLACESCGKNYRAFASEVERGRRFCSADCAHNAMTGPQHPNYKGGKWLKHGRRWQAVRIQVLSRDKVCRWCGAERSKGGRGLDVHHIKPRRDYLIVDIANELPNLVALCSACHTRAEMWTKHGRTAELPTWLRVPA